MPKDYAQGGSSGRQTRGPGVPGWLWLLAGIAIGFVAAAIYYISRPTAAESAAPANGSAKTAEKKSIAIPPKEPSRFAFYELLPNYEVVIPKESLKPEPKAGAAAPAGGDRFLIQVGSFKDRAEAEAQKANLALLGIESRVEKVTIDNDQTWYRVRIGPERDQRRIEAILGQLDQAKVKALVMRVPG